MSAAMVCELRKGLIEMVAGFALAAALLAWIW